MGSFLKAILIPMVFAKFVESIGLGNFLAPKKKTGNTRKRTTKKHFKETVNEQPYEKYRKKSEDTTEEEKERYETMIKQKIAAQFEFEKDTLMRLWSESILMMVPRNHIIRSSINRLKCKQIQMERSGLSGMRKKQERFWSELRLLFLF